MGEDVKMHSREKHIESCFCQFFRKLATSKSYEMGSAISYGISESLLKSLLSLSHAKKLNIIKLLVDSLSVPEKAESEKTYTRRMIDKHSGKWVGDESPEELMQIVRENSSIREPLDF